MNKSPGKAAARWCGLVKIRDGNNVGRMEI